MPEPEHGDEQAFDSIAERDKEDMPGSWDTSGTESQRMTRLDDALPVVTAIQTFEETAIAPAEIGADELLDEGEVGSATNCGCPAYSS
jgi:hypothetical protein